VLTSIIIKTGVNELDDKVLEEIFEILVQVVTAMENEASEQSK
jgi:hypothetical protein